MDREGRLAVAKRNCRWGRRAPATAKCLSHHTFVRVCPKSGTFEAKNSYLDNKDYQGSERTMARPAKPGRAGPLHTAEVMFGAANRCATKHTMPVLARRAPGATSRGARLRLTCTWDCSSPSLRSQAGASEAGDPSRSGCAQVSPFGLQVDRIGARRMRASSCDGWCSARLRRRAPTGPQAPADLTQGQPLRNV